MNLQLVQETTPKDLLSLKELSMKHNIDYNYLYKWSVIKGKIKVYFRGAWKLSESDVLEFIRTQELEKLNRIRVCKGSNN